jgi:hypothetical protein
MGDDPWGDQPWGGPGRTAYAADQLRLVRQQQGPAATHPFSSAVTRGRRPQRRAYASNSYAHGAAQLLGTWRWTMRGDRAYRTHRFGPHPVCRCFDLALRAARRLLQRRSAGSHGDTPSPHSVTATGSALTAARTHAVQACLGQRRRPPGRSPYRLDSGVRMRSPFATAADFQTGEGLPRGGPYPCI